ncbi:MAG: NADH-quinone oxidoreductase subunit I [Deltaproteobacteria bacterium]|jgi:NADH-quinone oxidoreductase subunit I|nr:NADH-quinone oxidoreductase subunit I [Deltaproteobacteria bacterium]
MKNNGYFKELFVGAKSLLVGLGVTFKAFTQPIVTVQYPREKLEITPNYRGHIELVRDPETGECPCIVCGMCARTCPCGCITVKGEKKEGEKRKSLTVFQLDFTKCSLCGLCVESCPKAAIDFSQDYNIAGFTREEFHYDLIKRLEERG